MDRVGPGRAGAIPWLAGTKASVDQMAQDVTAFLSWTAEPELEERKRNEAQAAYEDVRSALEPKGISVFAISSATGDGTM